MKSIFCFLAVLLMLATGRAVADDKTPLTFEEHIRPVLKAHCFECHGEGKRLKGGLDVRLQRLLATGGDTGPAFVPGKASESLLLDRIRNGEMPPGKKKLTKDQVQLIERWIAQGARTAKPEPKSIAAGFHITPEEESFWSFQPIARPMPPTVKNANKVRTAIDAFLLAKLEPKGLSFSAEADRRTLIRRASFDLLGLPPAPKEVEDFVADTSPDAYEKLLDRLLASPHYGERWGRHWLDIAGYADSEGYSGDDPVRNTAYRYRDYVIRSFNADKPFDQFIHEQLAGDEMIRPPYEKLPPSELDKLIATGFLRMAPDGTASKEVDQKLASNQVVADTLQIVGTSMLGMTVHCAQCHNHRYDPIPQVDYYRMRAIFEPALDWKNWRAPAAREVPIFSEANRQKAAEIEKQAAKIDAERLKKEQTYIDAVFERELAKLTPELQEPVRAARNTPPAKRTPPQQKLIRENPSVNVTAGSLYLYDAKAAAELKTHLAESAKIRATKPVPDTIRALTEPVGKVPTTVLFDRGDHEQPKQTVTPGNLLVLARFNLGAIPEKSPTIPTTGRRLAFAHTLTSPTHPLTARVLVNRVWMHHFGKGIVATPADFGYLGDRPTHPELLDWLASDFMDGGWKLKRLHKLIMTSTAYRQVATRTPAMQKVDPDNQLLARMSVRRLEGETIRDAMLAVGGKLNTKMFGAPVPVMVDTVGQTVIGVDTTDGAGRPTGKVVPLDGDEFRRTVYVQVRRSKPLSALETFDAPMMTPNCECRSSSTVTPQALLLMNSRMVQENAEHFARRLQKEGTDVRAQVDLAWRLAFAAQPSPKDVSEGVEFVQAQAEQFRRQPANAKSDVAFLALANYCQALLSSNQFLYVD